jgi:hypothetical protein
MRLWEGDLTALLLKRVAELHVWLHLAAGLTNVLERIDHATPICRLTWDMPIPQFSLSTPVPTT